MATSASLEVTGVLSGAMRRMKTGNWVVGVVLRWSSYGDYDPGKQC